MADEYSSPGHETLLKGVADRLGAMTLEQKKEYEAECERRNTPVNQLDKAASVAGKYIIVTGSNTGVGYGTVKGLSKLGNPHCIVACRNKSKGDTAVASLKKDTGNPNIEFMQLDLNSLQSVKDFAKDYIAKGYPLDILINNAGIMAVPYATSVDGFEAQFQVNHLGHFLLTSLLLPLLLKAKEARILNLSSTAHTMIPAELPPFSKELFNPTKEKYNDWFQYGLTKAMNVLFTIELQNLLTKAGHNHVTVAAIHPGFVNTNLQANIGLKADDFAKASGITPLDTDKGANNSIYVAAQPGVAKGAYWDNTAVKKSHPPTLATKNQEALWKISVELSGASYSF